MIGVMFCRIYLDRVKKRREEIHLKVLSSNFDDFHKILLTFRVFQVEQRVNVLLNIEKPIF